MRKIVLPLIETDRSLLALQYAKKHFGVDQAEIIIVMVDEGLGISATREEEAAALSAVERKLEVIKKVLDGYQVITKAFVGKAGPCIVKVAREYNADYIVMTKSAQPDTLSVVGKTTDYVLNNAYCNVLIISENRMNAGEYKGLIYKKAQATVNLRGQIGDKQSECLLPSVDADCNYHFEVTVGKIRFFHTAYNPETGNWDMPPSGDQSASMDIVAGETADILVKANSIDGKADRIRIINRGMKQEAVFEYKITAAVAPQPLEIPDAPGAMPAPAVISLDDEEKINDIAPEASEDAENLFEEMPVPSIYDTAEFEGIVPENALDEDADQEPDFDIYDELKAEFSENNADEYIEDAMEAEETATLDEELGIEEESATLDEELGIEEVATPNEELSIEEEPATFDEELGFEEEPADVEQTEGEKSEYAEYLDKTDFSFSWDDFKADTEEESFDSTLTGLEMFAPNDDEINSIVDELKDTITSLDNDIAERESQTLQFGMPDDDLDLFDSVAVDEGDEKSIDLVIARNVNDGTAELVVPKQELDDDINLEDFFSTVPTDDNDEQDATTPAFDDIFEMIPPRDPMKDTGTSTLEHDFDKIINEFRTSQVDYVSKGLDEDDFDLF